MIPLLQKFQKALIKDGWKEVSSFHADASFFASCYNDNGSLGKIFVKGDDAIKTVEFDSSELDEGD